MVTLTSGDKIRLKIAGAIALVGLWVILIGMIPAFNPPQCSGSLTPNEYGSNCIIGANIGAGLIFFLGAGLVLLGGLIAAISIVFNVILARTKSWKLTLLLIVGLFAALMVASRLMYSFIAAPV